MELKPVIKQEFFPNCQRVEPLTLDSSAYLIAKQCYRLFFYQIVLGYRPKGSAVHLNWGSAYHKFREVLDAVYKEEKKSGDKSNEYLITAPFKPAYIAAIGLWDKLQGKDPAPDDFFGFMTRVRLHDVLQFTWKHWAREKQLARIEVIATEQLINVTIAGKLKRTGKIDQVILRDGELWVRDFKTTSTDVSSEKGIAYYQRSLEPNDQFTGYEIASGELAGEPAKGLIVEVMMNKAKHKTDRGKSECGPYIREFTTQRTPDQIERWKKEQIVLEKMLDVCREEDVWPQMDNSRVNCKFCPFHRPCSIGTEKGAEYNLQNYYEFAPHDHTKFGEVEE